MIDPEQPDRMACPMMLQRGAPEETGGCIGRECAAFRWVVLDTGTGAYWMPVTYPTQSGANVVTNEQNLIRDSIGQPRLETMGVCGKVPLL